MSVERVACGVVASAGSPVTVLTVARHTRIIVASLIMTNVGQTDVDVSVRISAAGRTYRVLPAGLSIGGLDSFHLITPFSVEPQESLTIEASQAGVLEYYITGAKEPGVPSPTDRAA